MPDDDKIPSEEEEGGDLTPPYDIPDDDVISFADQGVVEGITPSYRIQYSDIFLFEETKAILLFKKRIYKASIYVVLMAN